jgi:HD superfamily phosphohydrolase
MEFHDILHGLMRFSDKNLTSLLADLIDSPEIHRLRNMRQMNFDVPLIQELGRSRRLPHSIGVTYMAVELAHKSGLDIKRTKELLAASILHDAAIPPYGHLVESELKRLDPSFDHEKTLSRMIRGVLTEDNEYLEIVFNKQLKLASILSKHGVDQNAVIDLVCPKHNGRSALSADIDIDNIDNVHRMAAMLGWDNAKENIKKIISGMKLNSKNDLLFSNDTIEPLKKWLDFRQRIYTLIIAHPECIPYNALQNDLVRIAVKNGMITPQDWYKTEPEFEEQLRQNKHTSKLARQLISGCEYQLIDYVWLKNFNANKKRKNAEIADFMYNNIDSPIKDTGYFIWNEKGLVSREIEIHTYDNKKVFIGKNSTSCMIALIKTTSGKVKPAKRLITKWRNDTILSFCSYLEVDVFDVDFPENYTGSFYAETDELTLEIN